MRVRDAIGIKIGLTAALAMVLAGCAQAPRTPDGDYRQAFEKALTVGQCAGQAVENMWAAYGRWYAVASSIAGYQKTDEAAALLRQGQMFQIIGCPAVARASYAALLLRFPEESFASARDSAQRALQSLPPPEPGVAAPPVPVRPMPIQF